MQSQAVPRRVKYMYSTEASPANGSISPQNPTQLALNDGPGLREELQKMSRTN